MKNVDEWCAGGMRGQQDEEMSVQSMGEMGKDFFPIVKPSVISYYKSYISIHFK